MAPTRGACAVQAGAFSICVRDGESLAKANIGVVRMRCPLTVSSRAPSRTPTPRWALAANTCTTGRSHRPRGASPLGSGGGRSKESPPVMGEGRAGTGGTVGGRNLLGGGPGRGGDARGKGGGGNTPPFH